MAQPLLYLANRSFITMLHPAKIFINCNILLII